MIINTTSNPRTITADDGMRLIRATNEPDSICSKAYLGISDAPAQWREISAEQADAIITQHQQELENAQINDTNNEEN